MKKIIQYSHYPNSTELGKGTTHETYLLISSDIDATELFPVDVEVAVTEETTQKEYKLKSASGSEFRVNQMGQLFRDFNIHEGDNVTFTKIEEGTKSSFTVKVINYNRVLLSVSKNGTEIAGIDRLSPYGSKSGGFTLNVSQEGSLAPLTIVFDKSKKKRSDSPAPTDFYSAKFNGTELKKGQYAIDLDSMELLKQEKGSYNVVVIDEKGSEVTHVDGEYSDYIELLLRNHNLVLTGAPGTGKTYLAKQIAASMVGRCRWNELSQGQKEHVEFVQFHPSFDYTDFVEGLRPDKSGHFVRTDGIFKDFCKRAINHKSGQWPIKTIKGDTSFETIYQTIVDDIKNHQIVAYTRRSGTQGELHVDESGRVRYHMAQVKPQSEENMKLLYEYFLEKGEKDVQYKSETFYFDLISKLTAGRERPTKTIDYVEYSWMLQQLLDRAYASAGDGLQVNDYEHPFIDSDAPYVFIIDEINRGELSKIFGELFYSIEPDYRGNETRVKTQYINMVDEDDEFYEGFYVPKNVYIIGTMNDIDRGVEAMDFAIRRRFAWREVTASESAQNMGLSDYAKSKMDIVNAALNEKELGEAYFIGGAYFRKLTEANLEASWNYHLKGIITEYFRGVPGADGIVEEIGNKFLGTVNDETEAADQENDTE